MKSLSVRRLISLLSASALVATMAVASLPAVTSATNCTQTGLFRDGTNLTAALFNPTTTVTGTLDATGCNIGVYYGPGTSGTVSGADISGANYYGVVVNAASVNVTGANIHDIGMVPLNGMQLGVGVLYMTLDQALNVTGPSASGTLSGSTFTNYQKGGIVANGSGTAVTITNNTVTGQGPVTYIAQNGIQVGRGAKATVTGNTVTLNAYSGTNSASSAGILVVGGPCYGTGVAYTVGLNITKNILTNNDIGVGLFNQDASCNASTTKSNNGVKNNTISNDAVTNQSGDNGVFSAYPVCGYQAGIADVGHRDNIINNKISGVGYTPVAGDCAATPAVFLRFIDADASAHIVSNK